MAIAKYSTKIDPAKTIGEIQGLLSPYVSTMHTKYENGEAVALAFEIPVNGRNIPFIMPTKWEPVLETLKRQRGVPNSLCTQEQATRVAWRLVLLWIQGQIAFIETNMVKPEQVFLPYMASKDGGTLYDAISNKNFLLGDGN